MFTWLIAFIVIGGIVGFVMKDSKDGAAEGAATGLAAFLAIGSYLIIPAIIILVLLKACS